MKRCSICPPRWPGSPAVRPISSASPTAGSGPDAAPYFRVVNPETQLEKFDADGDYTKAWLAEEYAQPTKTALSYFEAIPKSWNMSPEDDYPDPVVGLDEGRKRALEAYENRDFYCIGSTGLGPLCGSRRVR